MHGYMKLLHFCEWYEEKHVLSFATLFIQAASCNLLDLLEISKQFRLSNTIKFYDYCSWLSKVLKTLRTWNSEEIKFAFVKSWKTWKSQDILLKEPKIIFHLHLLLETMPFQSTTSIMHI